MISDGKEHCSEDCSEAEKFNDNNNSIKDNIIKKYDIESSVNNYPMFVGEKNIQNSNKGFNRAVVKADESVVGADVMNIGIVGMQTEGESVVKAVEMQDAQGYVARCTTLSTSSFCLVVWSARKADESVVGADVMNIIGIMGMQTDGESVVEAVESTVVAAVAGDIVMGVQMDGKSVMDDSENAVDVVYADAAVMGAHTDDRRAAVTVSVVMGAFVLDAGTSSSSDMYDADARKCCG
jgi:hypothetical protein